MARRYASNSRNLACAKEVMQVGMEIEKVGKMKWQDWMQNGLTVRV